MASTARQSAFETNMADAELLVRWAFSIKNSRQRRERAELRQRVGAALDIPQKRRPDIAVVESNELLIVIKPESTVSRDDFADVQPLLRQAVVAGCAATETFLSDLVMDHIAQVTASRKDLPSKLTNVPMTVGQWLDIDRDYKYQRRGLHERVLRDYVARSSSTSPRRMGELLALLGVTKWSQRLDDVRGVVPQSSVTFLDMVSQRRNRIAHTGDRSGRSRALITSDEVSDILNGLRSVVVGLNRIVEDHFSQKT